MCSCLLFTCTCTYMYMYIQTYVQREVGPFMHKSLQPRPPVNLWHALLQHTKMGYWHDGVELALLVILIYSMWL